MRNFSWLMLIFIASFSSCSKKDASPEPNNTDLFIPKAFTPDGDGINDTFIVKGTNIAQYNIEIFDEAKIKIYMSDNISLGWDGRYKNQPMPAGNYMWVIVYAKTGEAQQKLTGYVELIR